MHVTCHEGVAEPRPLRLRGIFRQAFGEGIGWWRTECDGHFQPLKTIFQRPSAGSSAQRERERERETDFHAI